MSKINTILCYNGTILKYSPELVDHSPNVENIRVVPHYLGLTVPYISVKSDHSEFILKRCDFNLFGTTFKNLFNSN